MILWPRSFPGVTYNTCSAFISPLTTMVVRAPPMPGLSSLLTVACPLQSLSGVVPACQSMISHLSYSWSGVSLFFIFSSPLPCEIMLDRSHFRVTCPNHCSLFFSFTIVSSGLCSPTFFCNLNSNWLINYRLHNCSILIGIVSVSGQWKTCWDRDTKKPHGPNIFQLAFLYQTVLSLLPYPQMCTK